eukprot:scaffold99256_cov52-Phaeocystis_antarctica.AAC.1
MTRCAWREGRVRVRGRNRGRVGFRVRVRVRVRGWGRGAPCWRKAGSRQRAGGAGARWPPCAARCRSSRWPCRRRCLVGVGAR